MEPLRLVLAHSCAYWSVAALVSVGALYVLSDLMVYLPDTAQMSAGTATVVVFLSLKMMFDANSSTP